MAQKIPTTEEIEAFELFFRGLNIKNQTTENIIKALRLGYLEAARIEYHHDGDKLWHHSGNGLRNAVVKLLGCRLHFNVKCSSWCCKSLDESL